MYLIARKVMYSINNLKKYLIFAFKNHVFDKFNHDNINLHYSLKLYFYIFHTHKLHIARVSFLVHSINIGLKN